MVLLLKVVGILAALFALVALVLYRVDESRTTNTSVPVMTVQGSMLVRVVYHSSIANVLRRLSFGQLYAITFWNRIYVTGGYLTSANLIHEIQHVRQWHALGRIRFVLEYFYYLVKDGYLQHPFEVAARDVAGQTPWIR